MDDSSTEEQEFPGLYEKGKKNVDENNESNSSENFEKLKKSSKKEKGKKEKSDRQSYEALGADSEDDGESKLFRSPSKSKKSKTFKFPTSAKKEKPREKSREPDVKDTPDGKDKKSKEKIKTKDIKEKKKEKDKSKAVAAVDAIEPSEVFPIFGMSLGLAVERSKCHDGVKLPLVVRNCIDYLQENLSSDHIYKTEGVKTRIQQLKKCYNNRDAITEEMDVATASSLLKTFISEPILTTQAEGSSAEQLSVSQVWDVLLNQLEKQKHTKKLA